ncbi:UDP-N-acetylglucosamine 2-epimerase (non-hydrolyzing) [Candidatus Babeliales bacterium]|nr:UDP-N-acetylglucosamine 2-epimerase (non-hydrolyzing) [Candidatus Babeliales bacterium]
MKPIIVVIGTRAEAIKLLPVYLALKEAGLFVKLCATFQHSEMLQQVLQIFNIVPDFNLGIMKESQDLFHITESVLKKTKEIYIETKPSLVIVHGDTTTTMASALSAFYLQIPIAHVEAGLRTGDINHPFPEEMNRKVVGQIATYHFTPTALATANMISEGAKRENLFCTGNTIVDSLFWIRKKILNNEVEINSDLQFKVKECRKNNKKMVLLTAHRRESFDGGLLQIFKAMKEFAEQHQDVFIFYPYHPNPNVLRAIRESDIESVKNIYTMPPLDYKNIIYLLMSVDWIATDSGGIQEEAVSLGKKVICLRDITERHEGIWEGFEVLTGTDQKRILRAMEEFYSLKDSVKQGSFVYGDGKACNRILAILKNKLGFFNSVKFSDKNSGVLKEFE